MRAPPPKSVLKRKNPNGLAFLLPPSLFKPHPLARQIAIRSHTRREQHLGACSLMTPSFGRKSPDTCSFAQTAETRRHRSTAADLGRQSLVCPFQPRPPRSRPSIFSSADLQSLTFPGRRPHGRRYESALWLLGAGVLQFGGGELFDGGAAAGRSGLGASRLTREISSRSYSHAIACGPSSSGRGLQVTRRGLFSVRGGRLQHSCVLLMPSGRWLAGHQTLVFAGSHPSVKVIPSTRWAWATCCGLRGLFKFI